MNFRHDILAVTETWLKPENLDSEILPGNDFIIHRQDRINRIGGGVLLAVCQNILSLRHKDLESNAEMLVCEVPPKSRKKLAVIVFYRPPDSDLKYIKEFKKSRQLIERCSKFYQVIVCGDFNLPSIDWTTGIATKNNNIHRHFTDSERSLFVAVG